MSRSIAELRVELKQLRQRVDNAEIFQSLYQRIGELVEAVPHRGRTTIELPSDDQSFVHQLLPQIQQQLAENIEPDQTEKQALLAHLKSANKAAREGAIQSINIMLANQLTDPDELLKLTNVLLSDDDLYCHVLEPKNQAVFGRAATVGMLRSLVLADQMGYFFLSDEKLQEIVDKVALLQLLETDTRGFVGRHGWAHMYYELPNLFSQLADRGELLRGDNIFLMTVLIERYRRLKTPLIMGEPVQTASYLVKLMKRHRLYEQYFLMELRDWRAWLSNQPEVTQESQWHLFFNYQRLESALLLNGDLPKKIANELIEKEI